MGRRGRRKPERGPRERLGREAPGAVLSGPPITITCDCGTKRELRYGETWTCQQCGRIWDTNDIPRDDYELIRRVQLRFRALPIALGLTSSPRSRSSSCSPATSSASSSCCR